MFPFTVDFLSELRTATRTAITVPPKRLEDGRHKPLSQTLQTIFPSHQLISLSTQHLLALFGPFHLT